MALLKATPTLGLDLTIQALTQLDFNFYVVFLRDEASEAVVRWSPLDIALGAFDPQEASWSFRGDMPVVSVKALKQYLLG
jgi:hypothetical protein